MQNIVETFLSIFDRGYDGAVFPAVDTLSINQAYAIQADVIGQRIARGESIAGYKVGCTSNAIQSQFGLDEPIYGHVMNPFVRNGPCNLAIDEFQQPAIEPEFVVTIGQTISTPPETDDELVDAIDHVAAGIEMHHYKFWNGVPTIQELIASNGLHASVIISTDHTDPRDVDWENEQIHVLNHDNRIAEGCATDIMGGPLKSLHWLISHLHVNGMHLKRGDIVIPGSATELIRVDSGDSITASFSNIGAVTVGFQ